MKNQLNEEIEMICDPEIKRLVRIVLDKAPESFWTIAASSTGKYHPEYAAGERGLIRHTKAVVRIADHICTWTTKFSEECNIGRDIIIAACILHDTYKVPDGEKYTRFNHPILATKAIIDERHQFDEDFTDIICKIADAVSSHMGRWNTPYRGNDKDLPLPHTPYGKIVSLSDYLASRKEIIPNFSLNEEIPLDMV